MSTRSTNLAGFLLPAALLFLSPSLGLKSGLLLPLSFFFLTPALGLASEKGGAVVERRDTSRRACS